MYFPHCVLLIQRLNIQAQIPCRHFIFRANRPIQVQGYLPVNGCTTQFSGGHVVLKQYKPWNAHLGANQRKLLPLLSYQLLGFSTCQFWYYLLHLNGV